MEFLSKIFGNNPGTTVALLLLLASAAVGINIAFDASKTAEAAMALANELSDDECLDSADLDVALTKLKEGLEKTFKEEREKGEALAYSMEWERRAALVDHQFSSLDQDLAKVPLMTSNVARVVEHGALPNGVRVLQGHVTAIRTHSRFWNAYTGMVRAGQKYDAIKLYCIESLLSMGHTCRVPGAEAAHATVKAKLEKLRDTAKERSAFAYDLLDLFHSEINRRNN